MLCDVMYYPDDEILPDIEAGQELCSFYLEKTPSEFDVILFSVSFENDLLNVIRLLRLMRLPILAGERDESHPLIIGGGIVPTANPEPFAPFFDALFLGEAEAGLDGVIELYGDADSRGSFLEKVAKFKFVYVPLLESPKDCKKVRAFWKDVVNEPTCSCVVTPFSSFGESFMVEVSRGCPRRCNFCLSSYVCRPVRFVSVEAIKNAIEKRPVNKVGLLGTSVSEHKRLPDLIARYRDVEFSFSSIRIDAKEQFFNVLRHSGARTLTFGIEAASQRLREAIGKPVPDELIFERLKVLSSDFEAVKLYFMVGLPGEEDGDISAFDVFLKKAKGVFKGRISLSIAPFVPKPFTPFEREPFAGQSQLKSKIKRIKKIASQFKGVNVNYDLPKWSEVQALISCGDRDVGFYLAGIKKKIDKERYLSRKEGTLPWRFITLLS